MFLGFRWRPDQSREKFGLKMNPRMLPNGVVTVAVTMPGTAEGSVVSFGL